MNRDLDICILDRESSVSWNECDRLNKAKENYILRISGTTVKVKLREEEDDNWRATAYAGREVAEGPFYLTRSTSGDGIFSCRQLLESSWFGIVIGDSGWYSSNTNLIVVEEVRPGYWERLGIAVIGGSLEPDDGVERVTIELR